MKLSPSLERKIRKINILLVIIFALFIVAYGASRGFDYIQVQGLLADSKQLSDAGKYKEALSQLELAQSKWSPQSTMSEINREISKDQELADSNDNFEQGKIQYDGENYVRAIEYFDKVILDDNNYQTAQSYREIAQKKINDIKSIKKSVANAESANTNALSATTTTRSNENLAALCSSDKESFKADANVAWINKTTEIVQQPNGSAFLQSWGSILKAQLAAKIEQIASARETYCLEHNRDYSEYVMPSLEIPSP